MKAYERFLKYVSVWTTSDETSETVPSADRELVLAELLVEEMKELGIEDARVDEKGYVYGSVPATLGCENAPALGLIAHMDTAPDASGDIIHPQIIENYDGKDVVLGTSGKTIKVEEFPYLADLKGRTLITTDGTTLLGADDKAGIAEVLTVVDEILKEGLPHGKICIGFTPDEEIARGREGRIVMKMNSLTDVDFIEKVAQASRAGVKIDLIIRGICCILPGVKGYTENLRVTSVVGRFLEHPRIFSFGTGSRQKIYIGSADMMTRNTEKRVEVACTILDEDVKRQINHYLKVMLSDNIKARVLQRDGTYQKREQTEPFVDSQAVFMEEALQNSRKPAEPKKAGFMEKIKDLFKR